jgi:hypothetical protein
MCPANDSAEGMHLGEALALQERSRIRSLSHRTESLAAASTVHRETDFGRQRRKAPIRPRAVFIRRRDRTRPVLNRGNAGKLRAIRRRLGNAGSYRTAWWTREDSNLQPDRYEWGYLIENTDEICVSLLRQPTNVHNRFTASIGEPLVGKERLNVLAGRRIDWPVI